MPRFKRFYLTSDHSFKREPSEEGFRTAKQAWRYAAEDLACSDHGADEAEQAADVVSLLRWAYDMPGSSEFTTCGGITFQVIEGEDQWGDDLPLSRSDEGHAPDLSDPRYLG